MATGYIAVDGKKYTLQNRDGMYIGMGAKEISFESENADAPSSFPALTQLEVYDV